jgi:hypothetical protein
MCQACEPYRQTVVTTASFLRAADAPALGAARLDAINPAPTPPTKPRRVSMWSPPERDSVDYLGECTVRTAGINDHLA